MSNSKSDKKNNVNQEDVLDRAEYRLRKAYNDSQESTQIFYQKHKLLFWLLVLLVIGFVAYYVVNASEKKGSASGSSASSNSSFISASGDDLVSAPALNGGALRYPNIDSLDIKNLI